MEILKQALENYSLQMDNLRKKQEEMLVKLNEKIPKSNKFVKDIDMQLNIILGFGCGYQSTVGKPWTSKKSIKEFLQE